MTAGDLLFERWRAETDEKLRRYEHLNRLCLKGQVVFAGSSLVEQFPVHELMQEEGLQGVVYNRGVSGYTAEDFSKALGPCVLDLEPGTLVLSIGTNDLNDPAFSLPGLLGNVDAMLGRIQEALPDTRIIWIAFYPVNEEAGGFGEVFRHRTNEKLREANKALSKLMGSRGITVLDAGEVLSDEEGRLKREYTPDGIHLYAEGCREVFRLLCPLLWRP